MYNKLIFEKFFNDERQEVLIDEDREIALSLVTPKQIIHAEPTQHNPLVLYHFDLSLQIISDIYKITKPTSKVRRIYYASLLSEIAKYIKNDEKNFIIARYILSNSARSVVWEFPYYITQKEFNEVKKLVDIFNFYKVHTSAIIHQYDPIDSIDLPGLNKTFGDDNFHAGLNKALDYFEKNNCIVEYELNAPKEYILK